MILFLPHVSFFALCLGTAESSVIKIEVEEEGHEEVALIKSNQS
jgi:hypothetical protein